MARLKITRTNGETAEYFVSPLSEYAFELYAKKGFHKAFREDEKQSDVYWLARECIRESGETVSVEMPAFLTTIKKVEVLEDLDPLV